MIKQQRHLQDTLERDQVKSNAIVQELSSLMDVDQMQDQILVQPYLQNAEKLRQILSGGIDRQKKGGQLSNKFANSVISKAAQSIEEHEQCMVHKNESLVAFDYESRFFGCERCVFEGQYKDPKFISWTAREIKDEFDFEYYRLIRNRGGMEDLSPQLVIQNIRSQISQFFLMIRKKLDEIESEILRKIKDSDNLRTLAQLIQELNEECDDALLELIEEEKKMVDEKTDKSKFAFLVFKSHYYKDLIEAMRSFNDQMTTDIEKSKQQFFDLIKFEPDEDVILESLVTILSQCLKVDNKPFALDVSKFGNQNKKVQVDQANHAYAIKENKVLQIDLINKKINEIQELKDIYIPKLMAIDDQTILLIGGQSTMDYRRQTVIKKICLMLNNSNGEWKTTPQAVMKKQRVSFSACFVGKSRDFVFVSGGFGAGRNIISECEVFNVADNFWTLFPSMQTKRASHSLLLTDNLKWIYAFGGINEDNQPLNSIERCKINNLVDPSKDLNTEWQLLSLQLDQAIMNIGCFVISTKEILLFGGMNELGEKLQTTRMLTIENEDKGLLKLGEGFQNEMEEGDAFANCSIYHTADGSAVMNGTDNSWIINAKERRITKFMQLIQ